LSKLWKKNEKGVLFYETPCRLQYIATTLGAESMEHKLQVAWTVYHSLISVIIHTLIAANSWVVAAPSTALSVNYFVQ